MTWVTFLSVLTAAYLAGIATVLAVVAHKNPEPYRLDAELNHIHTDHKEF